MCRLMQALTFFVCIIMKYLFIDESFDEYVFVVGGILVDSEKELFLAYNQFKKQINRIPLIRKQKEKFFFEFKSSLLYGIIKNKIRNGEA